MVWTLYPDDPNYIKTNIDIWEDINDWGVDETDLDDLSDYLFSLNR